MIQLRLFRASEPFQQLDQRTLDEGELIVGRDPSAHWVIPDEACEVSRRHCILAARDGAVVLRDTSSNGVFLGDNRRRVERDTELALNVYETIHLGEFMIVIEPGEPSAANDASPLVNLYATSVSAEALAVRSDWDEPSDPANQTQAATSTPTDAAMLDAFCVGAGLDTSHFIGEDPVLVMHRAGAIYKQMVLGLGELLSERHSVKGDLNMDRTTVGASGNNPFKWAPTRRVAIDLLRERRDGFLSGPTALKASFEDLKKHAVCLMAGARASVDAVLAHLSPDLIEEEAKSQSGLWLNRHEACWRQYHGRHDALAEASLHKDANLVNGAFKQGYERQLRELDEMGTRS